MAEFPDVITQETNRLLLEQRQAEENAARALLCDAIAGYNALHAEVTGSCVDMFSDAPCGGIDSWSVVRVARLSHG